MYKDIKQLAIYSKDDVWAEADYEPIIYLHWTAGWYGQSFGDYHICIDKDGSYEVMCDTLAELKAHTWNRNSGAVGIALECCVGAGVHDDDEAYYADLGENPPTDKQIETACRICAILCEELDIPADNILTHAEAADEDDYGLDDDDPDCRWDLAVLHEGDEWGTGGEQIRKRVRAILGEGK